MEDLEELFNSVINHLSGISDPSVTDVKTGASKHSDYDNKTPSNFDIPLGVSNHHIHLSQADADTLFGKNYEFTKLKELSQIGQYAATECVILAGPKGVVEKVRILGPVRSETQVELTATDCFKLGVKAPFRLSGDLDGTPGCTIIGPKGALQLNKGCMVAQRHIHMAPTDAAHYGVSDRQSVSLEMPGKRGGILSNVKIRVSETFRLECHLDTEEANALGVSAKNKLRLIK
jgi:propanediol utilization protein